MNMSQKSSVLDHFIFMDLDDTLICSSYITQTLFTDNPLSSGDINVKVLENIGKVENAAMDMITEVVSMGVLTIITNAQQGWIEYVMNTHFLRLKAVLNKHKIPIVSARELHEKKFPNNPILWKVATFSQQIKQYENIYKQLPTVMLSIGDGNHERIAFGAVAGNHMNKNPDNNTCVFKSLKLMDTPQPHHMMLQLKYLVSILPSVLYIASQSNNNMLIKNIAETLSVKAIPPVTEHWTPPSPSQSPTPTIFKTIKEVNPNINPHLNRLSLTKLLHLDRVQSTQEISAAVVTPDKVDDCTKPDHHYPRKETYNTPRASSDTYKVNGIPLLKGDWNVQPIRLERDFEEPVEANGTPESAETNTPPMPSSVAGSTCAANNNPHNSNISRITATAPSSTTTTSTDIEIAFSSDTRYNSNDTNSTSYSDVHISPTILSAVEQRTIHETLDIALLPKYCMCHIFSTNTVGCDKKNKECLATCTCGSDANPHTSGVTPGSNMNGINNSETKDPVTYFLIPHDEFTKCD